MKRRSWRSQWPGSAGGGPWPPARDVALAVPSIDFTSPEWGVVAVFFAQAALTEFHYMTNLTWPKGLPPPSFPGELKILASDEEEDDLYGLYELPHGILRFHAVSSKSHVASSVTIAARTAAELAEYKAEIRKLLPKKQPIKGAVPISFWTQGRHGNSAWPRSIEIPKWKDIEGNYSAGTREAITGLIQNFEPESGKLVLWHGEPGTGKTWALRAVLGEWSKWCEPQYIVDPEKLFGTDSSYLLQVLMEESTMDYANLTYTEMVEMKAAGGNGKIIPPWRVLILEDTGELLSQDAKERSGQGLSRLLNVTDGLIGQGLRVIVLITTNEPLSKLHPAVSRPGRTAAEIEFTTFSTAEAETWLLAHGIKDAGLSGGNHTLAECYARLAGRKVRRKALQKVGF